MKTRRLAVVFSLPLILVALFVQGCSPIYVANSYQTPLLDEKGELNGNIQIGSNGSDIQGAYAISDHVGIAAAASFAKMEAVQGGTVNEDYHKHTYGEAALTYFKPFGIGRFEILGGFGLGSASAVDNFDFTGSNSEERTDGNYNKVFGQTNIGLETGFIETGLSLRLAQVTFTEFETDNQFYDGSEGGTFFEPAVFARLGWKNVKLEAQYGVIAKLQDELYYPYQPFHLSIGLNVNLKTR